MSDSEHHDRQKVAFPETDLTRRLLRRATQPNGVINLRPAAVLHSRSSFGLGARLEMLDSLKNRYGLAQATGAAVGNASLGPGAMPFVASSQRMSSSSAFDRPPPSVAGQIGTSVPATSPDSKASLRSSPPQYRVKRPSGSAELTPSKLPSSPTVSLLTTRELGVVTHSVPAIHLQRKVRANPSSEPDTSNSSASSAVEISPASTRESPLAGDRPTQTSELLHPASLAQLSLPSRSNEQTVAKNNHPLSPQRHATAASIVEVLGVDVPTSRGSSTEPLLLRRKVDRGLAIPVIGDAAGPFSAPAIRASARTHLSDANASASTGSLTTELAAQRQLNLAGQTVDAAAAPPLVGARPPLTRGAVANEIHVVPAPAGASAIVWRKANPNGTGRTRAMSEPTVTVGSSSTNEFQIMRQTGGGSEFGGHAPAVAAPASAGNGIDVTRIAEQVGRMIARQLRVERERRGGR